MQWIDGLSKSQRVVIVVALGLALGTVGCYIANLRSGVAFGWTGYAPLASQVIAVDRGLPNWLRLIIWLVLIVLWAVASIRLLRPESANAAAHQNDN
jgi:hypothetical protein